MFDKLAGLQEAGIAFQVGLWPAVEIPECANDRRYDCAIKARTARTAMIANVSLPMTAARTATMTAAIKARTATIAIIASIASIDLNLTAY